MKRLEQSRELKGSFHQNREQLTDHVVQLCSEMKLVKSYFKLKFKLLTDWIY